MPNFQKPAFNKKAFGYSPEEVDSYIVPLLAQKDALIAENDSLKKQLLETLTTLQPAKENAERIRKAATEAELKAAAIIEAAKKQAQTLLASTKKACDEEIASYRNAVAQEVALFSELRKLVAAFNERAVAQYRAQLDALEKNAAAMNAIVQQSDEDFEKKVLSRMREQLAAQNRPAAQPAAPAEAHPTAEAPKTKSNLWDTKR